MEFNATIVVAFVSFVIFVFIMNWILYKPIDDIVQKRKNYIDGNYNEAKGNKDQSGAILEEKTQKINSAKLGAREVFSAESTKIKDEKREKLLLAKNSASKKLEACRAEFCEQENQAKESLKAEVINLAQLVSDKFLKEHEKIENVDYEKINQIMQG